METKTVPPSPPAGDIAARLARHGFEPCPAGYVRGSGTIPGNGVIEVLSTVEPGGPVRLSQPVIIETTQANHARVRLERYTLRKVLAALDHPRRTPEMLVERLRAGLHIGAGL